MNAAEQEIKALRKRTEELLQSSQNSLWKSVEEKNEAPSVALIRRADEFIEKPEDTEKRFGSMDRRNFFKWMTAASALVTSTACQRRPKDYLVPYVNKPLGFTYGKPVWYASSSSNGLGVLVKTREGRPIKLEGNSDHPFSRGGLDASAQAEILNLYNPERLRKPWDTKSQKDLSWDDVDSRVGAALTQASKGSIRLLVADVPSPSLKKERAAFEDKFKAQTLVYRPNSYHYLLRAYELATGNARVPYIDFEKADFILNVDADFLGTWLRPVEFTKAFTKRRNLHNGDVLQNRLVTFESMMSVTGVSSDSRFAISPSMQLDLLLALINYLKKDLKFDSALTSLASSYSLETIANQLSIELKVLEEIASALLNAKGRAVVLSGGMAKQSLEAQLAAIALNEALGAYGNIISQNRSILIEESSPTAVDGLLKDANDGKVEVLIVHSANPVYSSFGNEWTSALKKVPLVVYVGHSLNETARLANIALPESHFLESWGDAEAIEGARSVQQPAIDPLFSSRSFLEILSKWNGRSFNNYDQLIKENWKSFGVNTQKEWMDLLKFGVQVYTPSSSRMSFSWSGPTASITGNLASADAGSGFELVAYDTVKMRDGDFANNAWLQELPDPITKVTWDNFAALSPKKANELGVHQNDIVELRAGEASISLPVFVQPGLSKDVVAVAVGYGRREAGSVGSLVGANAYQFLNRGKNGQVFISGTKVELTKTGEREELASTQHHFDIHGRDSDILNHATLSEFLKNPRAAKGKYEEEDPDTESMYTKHIYAGNRWGMNVDLNKCTGCNACVVACYAENNVSIAGKDEVAYGRHMAWLRLDLYHKGSEENPESTFQPMLCQQCEKAPCETVCPVLATVHSSDGLNDMVYNRCVGTRYCANNCPYKVRRFNYFQYSDSLGGKMEVNFQSPLSLMLNPDVTVRTRGVMEKCTFCVQRIRSGVDEAKSEKGKDFDYRVEDGKIKTACEQSCPAEVITFGDLNDPKSRVSKLAKKAQTFKVLSVLNTNPSVSYMPRVRNKGLDA